MADAALLSDADVGLAPTSAPAPVASPLLSDEDVGLGAAQPNAGTLAESPFVGFNKGLADTVGAPVDLANWGMKKLGVPVSNDPVMGSNWIDQNILGAIGANPQMHQPRSAAERLLQGAGEGARGRCCRFNTEAGRNRAGYGRFSRQYVWRVKNSSRGARQFWRWGSLWPWQFRSR
jgi:hypothetical protein